MKKIVLFALILCLAASPVLFGAAQASEAAEACEPATSSSLMGIALSVFPMMLWAPMLITLVIMVGSAV